MSSVNKIIIPELEELIGRPFPEWAHDCHRVSLRLLKTGVFGEGRIARGWADKVPGQHSWIVQGNLCYDPAATIIDPTLWSYDENVQGIWAGRNLVRHFPHGLGSIYQSGQPSGSGGDIIELTPKVPLSRAARDFLGILGPLDLKGWVELIHSPVQDWPAREIITAIDDTRELAAFIPVDILGMLTDRNPGGLYLP